MIDELFVSYAARAIDNLIYEGNRGGTFIFSIAKYRLSDYRAASIPVLPVKSSNQKTKIHMVWYIVGFFFATLMLIVFNYTSAVYLFTVPLLGLAWLLLCIKGFKTDNDTAWARQMFRFSLVVITATCAMTCI